MLPTIYKRHAPREKALVYDTCVLNKHSQSIDQITKLPICDSHIFRDLIFQTLVTFLLVSVRFISKLSPSCFSFFLFRFQINELMTKVGLPFNSV